MERCESCHSAGIKLTECPKCPHVFCATCLKIHRRWAASTHALDADRRRRAAK